MVRRERPTMSPHLFEDISSQEEGWVFLRGHGLLIDVHPSCEHLPGITSDRALIGYMDFMPKGAQALAPGAMTFNLLAGIEDLQSFFEMIDKGKPEPEYLFGYTNERMANATKRLGFTVTNLTSQTKDSQNYQVVGKTSIVRQRLDELLQKTDVQERTIVDLLQQRLDSQAPRSISFARRTRTLLRH